VPVRQEWREAAQRAKDTRDKALGLEDIALEALKQTLDVLPALALNNDKLVDKLAQKKKLDPSTDDILEAAEELADSFDPESTLSYAPAPLRAVIEGAFVIASMSLTREKLEKLTYQKILEYAVKKDNKELVHYLEKYPRLSEKVILWVRSRLERRLRR